MRFSLQREVLLKPLAQVVNVVERRQTLPVLANLLVKVREGQLSLTGTDLEVEMVARTAVDDAQDGETTIPARKLFEIVRALPDGSKVTVSQTGDKVTVQAGRAASPWRRCQRTTSLPWMKSKPRNASRCPRRR